MVRYVNLCHQFSAIVGLCLGLILVTWIPTNESDEVSSCPESSSSGEELRESKPIYNDNEENLMFVGVMTAAKFLDSRAAAVYDTWGKTVPGRIAFFTGQNSKTNSNIPIVPLEGVDDVYPPQKKSFLMLKYMHDHFLDDYEWFMRSDDDLYVRTDLLANFLRSIRNDKVQFIGQAGLGSNESMEELGLESKDNFCMGGPGMVFSKLTLKKVVPHIKECLQNLYTTHEDVEIGRCIRRFSNVTCTWSYQMQELFYHNRSRQNAYVGRLKSKEVLGAITLHPFKSPSKMYRIHNYFNKVKVQTINQRMLKLQHDISRIKSEMLQDKSSGGLTSCDVSQHLAGNVSSCHSSSYSSEQGFISVDELSSNEKVLLMHRIGIQSAVGVNPSNICYHHKMTLLDYFDKLERTCCDPLNVHKISSRKSLRSINMDMALYLSRQGNKKIKAGQKLCPSCRKKCCLQQNEQEMENEENHSDIPYGTHQTNQDQLSVIFTAAGCSPFKATRVGERDRSSYAKRKLSQMTEKCEELLLPYGLDAGEEKGCKNCNDLDNMVYELKEKCAISPRTMQLQILTLALPS
ncbi:Chondroitin sulfate synthase 1 [Nymphon striatum]|nr:Chondroitin sulfate synthase 1 [Nymphon striatum]